MKSLTDGSIDAPFRSCHGRRRIHGIVTRVRYDHCHGGFHIRRRRAVSSYVSSTLASVAYLDRAIAGEVASTAAVEADRSLLRLLLVLGRFPTGLLLGVA